MVVIALRLARPHHRPPARRPSLPGQDGPMTSTAGAAYRAMLDELIGLGEWLDAQDLNEIDRAEGFRHLGHLLAVGLDHHLESDPERPMFTRIVSPFRKMQGDNPDAVYYWTKIKGDRDYRITGRNTGEGYLSFTVHGADPNDPNVERVIADVNETSLVHDPDGTGYEITVSPDPRPEGFEGNWLQSAPDAHSIVTRHYFERPTPAASDPDVHVVLRIEPVDDPGPAPTWTQDAIAERLAEVATFVASKTSGMTPPTEMPDIPFVSRTPNVLPQPFSFRDAGIEVLGAVDAHYSMGPYELGEDEALVLEGTIPAAAFVNVMLWNKHMQTYEYRSHQTSLNRTQLELGPDDSYRIVIANRDPGVPNWLDTEGHTSGSIFWRFFLAEERPSPIECTVVPIVDL